MIAYKGDLAATETLGYLVNLRGERSWIAGVAFEGLDRKRRASFIAQQADDDLTFPLLAVTVVSEGRQFVVLAFQIAAGHIVEKELPLVNLRRTTCRPESGRAGRSGMKITAEA